MAPSRGFANDQRFFGHGMNRRKMKIYGRLAQATKPSYVHELRELLKEVDMSSPTRHSGGGGTMKSGDNRAMRGCLNRSQFSALDMLVQLSLVLFFV